MNEEQVPGLFILFFEIDALWNLEERTLVVPLSYLVPMLEIVFVYLSN